jgi:hypothetical protein
MARKDETGVPEFLIPFQVDQSWYERYWWQDSARRKRGMFAFFRRILLEQRLARRQDVRAEHDDADCLHPGIHDPPLSSAAAGFFSTIGACRALRVAPAKVAAPKDN